MRSRQAEKLPAPDRPAELQSLILIRGCRLLPSWVSRRDTRPSAACDGAREQWCDFELEGRECDRQEL